MKKYVIIPLLLAMAVTGFAQTFNGTVGEPNPNELGIDTAQQKLAPVSVSKFEDAGLWHSSIPHDLGITTIRRLPGGPLDKEPLPQEGAIGISEQDDYVLGVKVQFFKRGMTEFSLYPVRPLPIEGICKTVSLWIVGRNTKHTLKLLISDHFGNKAELTMGTLNFTGWKKLTVAIPPHIVQRDYHYNNKMGIKVEGLRVECDPAETYGTYYIYFDDLRAVSDLFAEENRDEDDMQDVW